MKASLVIITYNNAEYIPRLFDSIRRQTIFDDLEVIVLDNCSADNSAELCRQHSANWSRPARVEAQEKNHGFAVATNFGVAISTGQYVCSLNADTWLEPDCLEQLLRAVEISGSVAGCSAQAELNSNNIVPSAPLGFDIFGRPTWSENDHIGESEKQGWQPCFMVAGAGFIVRRDVWDQIGGFDAEHFMYGEDDDISWKLWLAGHQSVYAHKCIVHHRSHRSWEIKEFTRYLVNRNSLLVVAKNAQHILLICFFLQVLMVLAEGFLVWLLSRSWKFAWRAYFKAVVDCFRLWRHIWATRKFICRIRQRSDWVMAKMFLRFRINRWDMVKAFFLKGQRPAMRVTK